MKELILALSKRNSDVALAVVNRLAALKTPNSNNQTFFLTMVDSILSSNFSLFRFHPSVLVFPSLLPDA